MSDNAQDTIGQALREAREAQGMSREQAAARLRLMHRQIVAMETDDFESLGRPVFARGFVRNYAKLLEIDAESLLARMEGPRTEQAPVRRPEPPLPRSWLSSPWLILFLLAGLLAVAVPIGLYWWLNEGEDEFISQMPSAVKVEPVELGVATPTTDAPPAAAVPETPAAAVPAEPPPEAPVDVPAEPPAVAPDAAVPATPEPVAAALSTGGGVLRFDFAEDSWVEIRDASGRVIHRQLNPAGSSAEVRGRPPFRLLVGNAAQVRMTYNGRPIDLKPFVDVAVARFTLEE